MGHMRGMKKIIIMEIYLAPPTLGKKERKREREREAVSHMGKED